MVDDIVRLMSFIVNPMFHTGHFTSSVPQLFVSAMCHKSRNGQLEGACPPVYDLRTGLI